MKKCKKCGEEKPLDGFYKNASHSSGYTARCRSCICAEAAAHRLEHVEAHRARDKARSKDPNRVAANRAYSVSERRRVQRKLYEQSPDGAAKIRAQEARYAAKNPGKISARAKARYHAAVGNIERRPCESCGETKGVQAHHHDYSKPLDVEWLCDVCHDKAHGKLQHTG